MCIEQKCVVCTSEVDFESVKEEFEHVFEQLDTFGEMSLTEGKQMVVAGKVCSYSCYEQLP